MEQSKQSRQHTSPEKKRQQEQKKHDELVKNELHALKQVYLNHSLYVHTCIHVYMYMYTCTVHVHMYCTCTVHVQCMYNVCIHA